MVTNIELPQSLIDEFVGNAHGNYVRVKELLDQHPALLNANASWNEHAIEAAAQTGSVEIVNYLLSKGASLDICTAAMLGWQDHVDALLDTDPSLIQARGAHGIPLLYYPIITGNKPLAQRLVQRGASVNGSAPSSTTPLHGAIMFARPDLAVWLVENGADVNAKNYENKMPLTMAAENGLTELTVFLRQHGAVE